jgi:ubiquinone/menaquinone biosynthesis C-methylase UbiE
MQRTGIGRRGIAVAIGFWVTILPAYWGRGQSTSPTTRAPSKVDPKINEQFKRPNVRQFIKRFESKDREVYRLRHEIVAALGLKRGMAVADIGAGTGLYTRLIAQAVGPTGKVFAVEIAPEFLAHIAADARRRGQAQVATVLASQDTTNLPSESIDLAFMCDVYHHLEKPEKTLASIWKALRPHGRFVVVEFDRVDGRSTDFVLKHVRAGQDVFRREIATAGFALDPATTPPVLKENFFLRFQKVSFSPDSTKATHLPARPATGAGGTGPKPQ